MIAIGGIASLVTCHVPSSPGARSQAIRRGLHGEPEASSGRITCWTSMVRGLSLGHDGDAVGVAGGGMAEIALEHRPQLTGLILCRGRSGQTEGAGQASREPQSQNRRRPHAELALGGGAGPRGRAGMARRTSVDLSKTKRNQPTRRPRGGRARLWPRLRRDLKVKSEEWACVLCVDDVVGDAALGDARRPIRHQGK